MRFLSRGAGRMADGKLFCASEAATGTAWSPRVGHRTGGTIRVVDANKRRQWQSLMSASWQMMSAK